MRHLIALIGLGSILLAPGCQGGGGTAVAPDTVGGPLGQWLERQSANLTRAEGGTFRISIQVDHATGVVTVTAGDQTFTTAPAEADGSATTGAE